MARRAQHLRCCEANERTSERADNRLDNARTTGWITRSPATSKSTVAGCPGPGCHVCTYHARTARRAKHLRCSLRERTKRADNRLDNVCTCRLITYWPARSIFISGAEIRDAHRPSMFALTPRQVNFNNSPRFTIQISGLIYLLRLCKSALSHVCCGSRA